MGSGSSVPIEDITRRAAFFLRTAPHLFLQQTLSAAPQSQPAEVAYHPACLHSLNRAPLSQQRAPGREEAS